MDDRSRSFPLNLMAAILTSVLSSSFDGRLGEENNVPAIKNVSSKVRTDILCERILLSGPGTIDP